MMFLTQFEEIRDLLGFDDMVDINEAIKAALNVAETVISARIGSPFNRETFTDTFFADSSTFTTGVDNRTEFRLSRGFVHQVTSIRKVSFLEQIGTPDSIDLTPSVVIERERGVIRDFRTRYANHYVQVDYTAGFEVSLTDPMAYEPDQVPPWLKEAAKLQTLLLLIGSPSLKGADIELDDRVLKTGLNSLLASKTRYIPLGLLPL
jgi:hypothetical protein